MIHKLNFYFIKELDKYHINKLPKNIAIIYRDYSQKYDEKKILEIKKFCKLNRRKFYLANDLALVKKLNLDGAYIPSFNTDINVIGLKTRNMTIIGSAHNIREINQKKKQGVDYLFISPVFKTTKKNNFLGLIKFSILSRKFNKSVVALGGINKSNLKKINNLKNYGFASISYIKNNINKNVSDFKKKN